MTSAGASARRRQARVLLVIAFRNLFAGRAKSLIIGGIILFGAMLVVVGSALLDSIDGGMRRSIQGSLGGHVQVYHAKSRDALALYGNMMGEADVEPIEDFAALKRTLLAVPNVKTVVPMGLDGAMVSMGNLFDVALAKLRDDLRAGRGAGHVAYEAHKAHVRRMTGLLRAELAQAGAISDDAGPDAAERPRQRADLARAVDDRFWKGFDADQAGALEFLENRIAPLSLDGAFLFVRYAGTDLDTFFESFPGARIVEGTPVPRGRRGILLAKLYAEEFLKLRTARRLDKIKDARDQFRRRIAKDEELQRWVKENQTATRDILLQLDPVGARQVTERLQRALGTTEPDLQKLIVHLLTTDDDNFDARYRVFYDQVAPLLQLYPIKIGDLLTIKAPSRSGYVNSVSVPVYGFVEFKGLERSLVAGFTSLMDLMSFRDLYGFMTPERRQEVRALKLAAGTRAVARENAEAELFGAPAPGGPATPSAGGPAGAARETRIDESRWLAGRAVARDREDRFARVYSQGEIDGGVIENAAVILKDPRKIPEAIRDIESAARRDGFDVKAVSWQEASGMVGRFVTLARVILYGAIVIIFTVAIVIINNAMVMATLQRVKEIGTMRAIGAQRRFIVVMLLVETTAVGLLFGAVGAALGAGVVWLIRIAGGIPAANDTVSFFFSGPSLMPHLSAVNLFASLGVVLVVSVLSGLYPAAIATRVTPVEAMQADE